MAVCLEVPLRMGFPEKIAVRFTEEEADYISMRPILKQPFTAEELVGMILTATGKHPERIREILRAGTLVYNMYRYWWERLDVEAEAVAEILARFPDADPTRVFCAEECVAVLLESGGQPPVAAPALPALSPPRRAEGSAVEGATFEVGRDTASRKRLFRSRSFWDCLLDLVPQGGTGPVYQDYSYARRADVYALSLTPEQTGALARDAARLARRELRAQLGRLPATTRIVFVCPRLG